MSRLSRLAPRPVLIIAHDMVVAVVAIALTVSMRFGEQPFDRRMHGLVIFLPLFTVYAGMVCFVVGLHHNKWRFTSLPDPFNIFRATTFLAVSLLVLGYILVAPNVLGHFFFGKISILLYRFLPMFFLVGSRARRAAILPAAATCRSRP